MLLRLTLAVAAPLLVMGFPPPSLVGPGPLLSGAPPPAGAAAIRPATCAGDKAVPMRQDTVPAPAAMPHTPAALVGLVTPPDLAGGAGTLSPTSAGLRTALLNVNRYALHSLYPSRPAPGSTPADSPRGAAS